MFCLKKSTFSAVKISEYFYQFYFLNRILSDKHKQKKYLNKINSKSNEKKINFRNKKSLQWSKLLSEKIFAVKTTFIVKKSLQWNKLLFENHCSEANFYCKEIFAVKPTFIVKKSLQWSQLLLENHCGEACFYKKNYFLQ